MGTRWRFNTNDTWWSTYVNRLSKTCFVNITNHEAGNLNCWVGPEYTSSPLLSWTECMLQHRFSSAELNREGIFNSAELSWTECLSLSTPIHSTQDCLNVMVLQTSQSVITYIEYLCFFPPLPYHLAINIQTAIGIVMSGAQCLKYHHDFANSSNISVRYWKENPNTHHTDLRLNFPVKFLNFEGPWCPKTRDTAANSSGKASIKPVCIIFWRFHAVQTSASQDSMLETARQIQT